MKYTNSDTKKSSPSKMIPVSSGSADVTAVTTRQQHETDSGVVQAARSTAGNSSTTSTTVTDTVSTTNEILKQNKQNNHNTNTKMKKRAVISNPYVVRKKKKVELVRVMGNDNNHKRTLIATGTVPVSMPTPLTNQSGRIHNSSKNISHDVAAGRVEQQQQSLPYNDDKNEKNDGGKFHCTNSTSSNSGGLHSTLVGGGPIDHSTEPNQIQTSTQKPDYRNNRYEPDHREESQLQPHQFKNNSEPIKKYMSLPSSPYGTKSKPSIINPYLKNTSNKNNNRNSANSSPSESEAGAVKIRNYNNMLHNQRLVQIHAEKNTRNHTTDSTCTNNHNGQLSSTPLEANNLEQIHEDSERILIVSDQGARKVACHENVVQVVDLDAVCDDAVQIIPNPNAAAGHHCNSPPSKRSTVLLNSPSATYNNIPHSKSQHENTSSSNPSKVTAKSPQLSSSGTTSKVSADTFQTSHHSTSSSIKPSSPKALTLVSTSAKDTTASSSSSSQISHKKDLLPLPRELQYDEARLKQIDDEYRLQLIKNAEMSSKLKNGWVLHPHQKTGILKGLIMRRLVLAYDMGLGKTLMGCVWAKAFTKTFTGLKVYIICPVSLKEEWKRTAWETTGLKTKDDKASKKSQKTKKAQSKLKVKQKSNEKNSDYDIEIFSWAKVPAVISKSVQHYVVICDEAHNMQSMDSARTKDTLSLVLTDRCKGVLLLTGTPMKNGKPSNLFPLLKAVRHPFGDEQRLYEVFFCNGQRKEYGGRAIWDASGASNLSILNGHITSHVFHKTKEECLKQLPPKTREYKLVPVSSRYEIQHNKALLDMAHTQKSIESLDNRSGDEAILGAFQRVRLIAALAKIDAAVSLAKKILETENSLVVFSYFVRVAKEVHRKLNESGWQGELLSGETLPRDRQPMVDRFQAGISPVFVATFGAGGVGITLTAACTIILLDRPWTPGDALQAEDRVRRIGQTRAVKSIWLRAFQVDEQVDNLIEQKSINSDAVVKFGSTSSNHRQSAPKISVRKLVKSILDRSNMLNTSCKNDERKCY